MILIAKNKNSLQLLIKGFKVLAIAGFLTIIVDYSRIKNLPRFQYIDAGDGANYVAMARGGTKEVYRYFARRIFHPWIVGKLRFFIDTHSAFLIVARISLLIFLFFSLLVIHYKIKLSLVASIGIIFLPFIFIVYKELYVQTLFFVSLSSLYWFLLIYKRYLLTFFILLLLLLTHDASIIILFSLMSALLINIIRHPNIRKYYFYFVATIIIGILSSIIIASNMQTNIDIHRLPPLAFYFLRLPFWGIRNLTGLQLWVDTYKKLYFYTHEPLIIFNAPGWLSSISLIKQLGIYDWSFINVNLTLLYIFSIFGTGPTILLYYFKHKNFKINVQPVVFNTILFSGCASFILGPFLGLPMPRYYCYAWPVFFLILPILLREINQWDRETFFRLLMCYILSGWLFILLPDLKSFFPSFILILIEIILHVYTWHNLSSFFKKFYSTVTTR